MKDILTDYIDEKSVFISKKRDFAVFKQHGSRFFILVFTSYNPLKKTESQFRKEKKIFKMNLSMGETVYISENVSSTKEQRFDH